MKLILDYASISRPNTHKNLLIRAEFQCNRKKREISMYNEKLRSGELGRGEGEREMECLMHSYLVS